MREEKLQQLQLNGPSPFPYKLIRQAISKPFRSGIITQLGPMFRSSNDLEIFSGVGEKKN